MVIIECSSFAAHWKQLSGYLGLSFELIDNIRGNHPTGNVTECWDEALKQWIKQNYNTEKFGDPSWKTLLKAIARIDKLQFKKLAAKHKVKLEGEYSIESIINYTLLFRIIHYTCTASAVSVQIHHIEKDIGRLSLLESNVHGYSSSPSAIALGQQMSQGQLFPGMCQLSSGIHQEVCIM